MTLVRVFVSIDVNSSIIHKTEIHIPEVLRVSHGYGIDMQKPASPLAIIEAQRYAD